MTTARLSISQQSNDTSTPVPVSQPAPASAWPQDLSTPVVAEIDVDDLTIEGDLPAELDGDYLRNGANPRFDPIGPYRYPFDGDAMVHRIRIQRGRASYRNRFVRTPALLAELAAGRALWPGALDAHRLPGPALVGPALAHTVKDRPNMNIVEHAGRILALGESTDAFLLTDDLDTVGRETFGGLLTGGMSPHPKIDPRTGELVLFVQRNTAPYLTWSVLDRHGNVRRAATEVDGVSGPTLIHDMGLTEHWVVFVVSPLRIVSGHGQPHRLRWLPAEGAFFGLVPRAGGPTRWIRERTFWAWHVVNAYETASGTVVLDYPRWDAPGAPTTPGRTGFLARARIDPGSGHIEHETLMGEGLEMPTIDPRDLGAAHRIVAGTIRSGHIPLPPGAGDRLGWFDTQQQSLVTWGTESLVLGEQCFVPAPGDRDPRNGWWLVLATDAASLVSQLLVFAADNPGAGAMARIRLPHRIAVGMHGSWLPPGGRGIE